MGWLAVRRLAPILHLTPSSRALPHSPFFTSCNHSSPFLGTPPLPPLPHYTPFIPAHHLQPTHNCRHYRPLPATGSPPLCVGRPAAPVLRTVIGSEPVTGAVARQLPHVSYVIMFLPALYVLPQQQFSGSGAFTTACLLEWQQCCNAKQPRRIGGESQVITPKGTGWWHMKDNSICRGEERSKRSTKSDSQRGWSAPRQSTSLHSFKRAPYCLEPGQTPPAIVVAAAAAAAAHHRPSSPHPPSSSPHQEGTAPRCPETGSSRTQAHPSGCRRRGQEPAGSAGTSPGRPAGSG